DKPLNVLIFCDISSRSHVKSFFEIFKVLQQKGHEFTFVSSSDNAHYNKGYNVSSIIFDTAPPDTVNLHSLYSTEIPISYAGIHKALFPDRMVDLFTYTYEANYPKLNQLVKENKYDLMICDFMSNPCQDVAQSNSLPLIIGIQSLDLLIPMTPAFKISTTWYAPLTTEGMDFFTRYYYKVIHAFERTKRGLNYVKMIKELRKKYNVVGAKGYAGNFNYGLGLANTFFGFELAQELPPIIKTIGPILPKSGNKVSSEIQSFIDEHKSILYIGYGSLSIIDKHTMSLLLQKVLTLIDSKVIDGAIWGLVRSVESLDLLPEDISYNGKKVKTSEIIKGKHEHIRLLKWAPQSEILQHENVKLFITHSGLESVFEAIDAMTPMICMPTFGDQARNAAKVESIGIGKHISFEQIEDGLIPAITEMIQDKNQSVQMNLERMKLLANGSDLRIQLGAKVIEDFAKTAKICRKLKPYDPTSNLPPCEIEHLVPVSNRMNFIKLYSLDLIGLNFLAAFLFIYGFYRAVKAIL
ncbi:UDP-Glycosyltransferase/glycogen phosphorylase, partial [Neoconidiobolus thromboides FSU 785]